MKELDFRQYIAIQGGNHNKALERNVDPGSLDLKGENLDEFVEHQKIKVDDAMKEVVARAGGNYENFTLIMKGVFGDENINKLLADDRFSQDQKAQIMIN